MELNQRQEKFLKALLTSASIDEACKVADINRNTGYKYLRDETFQEHYRALRREAMQQVTSRLQKSSEDAVRVLNEIMLNDENSPASRVQASKTILEISYRSIELDDLAERVEKVEAIINGN